MSKKKIFYIGLFSAAIIGGGFYMTIKNTHYINKESNIIIAEPEQVKEAISGEGTENSNQENNTEKSINELNLEEAKRYLEKTESASEEDIEAINSLFKLAIADIEAEGMSFSTSEIANKYFFSDDTLISTLGILININKFSYDEASLIVNASNSSDVRQFIVTFTKDGQDNVYFVGNYNVDLEQMQLFMRTGRVPGATFG